MPDNLVRETLAIGNEALKPRNVFVDVLLLLVCVLDGPVAGLDDTVLTFVDPVLPVESCRERVE